MTGCDDMINERCGCEKSWCAKIKQIVSDVIRELLPNEFVTDVRVVRSSTNIGQYELRMFVQKDGAVDTNTRVLQIGNMPDNIPSIIQEIKNGETLVYDAGSKGFRGKDITSGGVTSVNTKTGDVVLNANDVNAVAKANDGILTAFEGTSATATKVSINIRGRTEDASTVYTNTVDVFTANATQAGLESPEHYTKVENMKDLYEHNILFTTASSIASMRIINNTEVPFMGFTFDEELETLGYNALFARMLNCTGIVNGEQVVAVSSNGTGSGSLSFLTPTETVVTVNLPMSSLTDFTRKLT